MAMSLFYCLAGINHFANPSFYLPLIPPFFPWPHLINLVSGAAEILLGLSILWPKVRFWSVCLIIAMLTAFIPAHIYFIQINSCIDGGLCVSPWIGWVRFLVVHPLLIYWAWTNRK